MSTPPFPQYLAATPPPPHISAAVDYTISEDRAGGHAAHAEAGFAHLAAAPPAAGVLRPSHPSAPLQQHQLELMRLEQQNKRRLLIARQMMQRNQGPGPRPFPPMPMAPPAADSSDEEEDDEEEDGEQEDDDAKSYIAQDPVPPADAVAGAPGEANPRHVVLYRVFCSSGYPYCNARVYDGQPCDAMVDGVMHLRRGNQVLNLSTFLRGRLPSAFVVYRELQCDNNFAGRSNSSETQHPREVVSVMPGALQATLQRISQFAPNYDAYHGMYPGRAPGGYPATLLSLSPSEYSPYFFYHHREALRQAAAAESCSPDLEALWSYLQAHPDPMSAKCDELLDQGRVSAETLPWLFRPNEVVVRTKGPLKVALMLRSVPTVLASNSVELECWNWGYDGASLQRRDKPVTLTGPAYDTIPINELSAYPLRYADAATKQRLLERGARFWELRHQTHVSYEGPDYLGERVYPWDSRCIIDYQMYRKFHSLASAFVFSSRGVVSFDNWPQQISATTATLSPTDTMLLPAGIHGFFLKDKKWVRLLVDNVAPVSWNKEAFDRLVLPQRTKNMVKSLVLVRKTDDAVAAAVPGQKRKRSDLIKGKGGGLIMLLHGGPGTGKTLTAESVAELAEMPLYNVTCGDVGTKPEAVETYLNTVLHLGQKWNCVLLLDEADVFLEQRSLSDLKRNSLVSVFLRTLEYYSGILILTSNRVGTFDAAFKSRIQVALHYPALDLPSRRAVWANFLEMLRSDGEEADYDGISVHLDELADKEMNGRQIRNAVTTARQLALFEGVRVEWGHVEQAIAAAADFDCHLRRVGAMEEEGWVMDGGSVGGDRTVDGERGE
ncbi:Fidgetin-like protein 1 [Parachaetomium inaequale]|uniref:Fidgetin-like protein 1 n=1 Tax=Parachaetomium inaequale TaxID=2588326 RepID=A0AAN6P9X2_9PEZI|nr:Fidgetin-like protein 1 [Parachaetomium inaequale]